MKALKIIGIIVGVFVAAILIVPLFTPSPAIVKSSIEISLEPEQIFPSVASFKGRDLWDPWLSADSTADARIEPKPAYVGSTYSWEGVAVGAGRMEVISVKENEYVESHLWFGNVESPALVEWTFEQVDGGTSVVWSFTQETKYPFGRLGMIFGKMFLQQSFDQGLSQLKELMESNPPAVVSCLGPITIEVQAPFEAMVADGSGTMDELGVKLGELFGLVFSEVGKQQLELAGPAFVHYLDFDEASGISHYLPGVMVKAAGKTSARVKAVSHPEMKVVRALHTGPYEKFMESYGLLMAYIEANGIEVTGEGFEFYVVSAQEDPNPANWKTVIAFPIK